MKDLYKLVITYSSDDPMKYCEITTFVKHSPAMLEKKIWKYYNTKYEYHGKAEAVVVELLEENIK